MEFENFTRRIHLLNDLENLENSNIEKQEQHRFQIVHSRMEKTSICKNQ